MRFFIKDTGCATQSSPSPTLAAPPAASRSAQARPSRPVRNDWQCTLHMYVTEYMSEYMYVYVYVYVYLQLSKNMYVYM